MDKLLKAFILVLLGTFLYTRVTNGTILFYIHQRFVTLTVVATVTILIVAASYYFQPAHDHDQNHDHDRDHDHDHDASWWSLLIITLPIVLGLLVPPLPLGATALDNREINLVFGTESAQFSTNRTNTSLPQIPPLQTGQPKGEPDNPLDWLDILPKTTSPDALEDQTAQLTGFVYRDDRFPDDSFLVGRFVVSCCVADASSLGIVVQWPEADMISIDQWVTVNGRFKTGEFLGQTLPVLIADQVEPTDMPDLPYFYR